jgi:hypothetical protein
VEGVNPVKMAKTMPRYHAAELDQELTRYLGGDDAEAARRRSTLRTGSRGDADQPRA